MAKILKDTEMLDAKPKLLGPPVYNRPKRKAVQAEKLAAAHIVSREESAKLEQCKLFVPNQCGLFKPKKRRTL